MKRFTVTARGVRFQSASRGGLVDPKFKDPVDMTYNITAESLEDAADRIEWVMNAEDFVFDDLLVTGPH